MLARGLASARGRAAPRRRASGGYQNVLVVVKHTPFEAYQQLKVRGEAPKALRWERLKDRHEQHDACVQRLIEVARKEAARVEVVSREALGRHHVDEDTDLLIAVGGDGTVLSSAHFVDSQTRWGAETKGPVILGVNSDPTRAHERLGACAKSSDERRSYGALCFATARTLDDLVPRVIRGEMDDAIQKRHRLAVTVRGPLSEIRMPPALNDVLVAHPSPAAVSRFRLDRLVNEDPGLPTAASKDDEFSFNVWSSGFRAATATGASGAMASAGGSLDMDPLGPEIQYMVREHLIGEADDVAYVREKSHGFVNNEHHLKLRWNSQHGAVYIDGHHTTLDLELGDEVLISSHATPLKLFAY